MGWGTFIAGRVLRSPRGLSASEKARIERDSRIAEEERENLKDEFVKYVLEESVLGHRKIQKEIVITVWIEKLEKASNYLFHFVTELVYPFICFAIILGYLIIFDISPPEDATGKWILLVIWAFLTFAFLLWGLTHFTIKRLYAHWVNQIFRNQGWDVKTLLKEMRSQKFPEHADLEGKHFRGQKIAFREFKQIPKIVKDTSNSLQELRKRKKSTLFPKYEDRD
jgi:hypothetical protein